MGDDDGDDNISLPIVARAHMTECFLWEACCDV